MSWVYSFRLADIDKIIDLGRETHQSLPEDDTVVGGYTQKAFESYNQLEPAPAVNHDIEDGCPSFIAILRHFVGGAEYSYSLDTNIWSKWIGQSVPQILSDDPDGKQLWEKLRGNQSDPYSLTAEGVKYRFANGRFLFGSEIQRFGESLDTYRRELTQACPEDSVVDFAPRGELDESVSGERFLTHIITQCVESGDTSLLWLY